MSTVGTGLSLGAGKEFVKPDLILPGQLTQENPLDPCPACDSRPHDAPEGIHDVHSVRKHPGAEVGDPKWNFPHCWKCGYRPGVNNAVSQSELQRQFAMFKEWLKTEQDKVMNGQPSTDVQAQNEEYKKELEQLKARLSHLENQPLEG